MIERLARLPQPVIAAVHGVCFTGGLELALACDFIVADATARFADTHGKWGLVGGWGMTQRLPRRIGVPAAKRMMMTARIVDAAEAQRDRPRRHAGAGRRARQAGRGLRRRILANSWHTNFAAKRLLRETDGMSLAEAWRTNTIDIPGMRRTTRNGSPVQQETGVIP